ncbi:MAG: glycosyltransferase family 2 protein, partial [Candidatus Sericytochromatia bacterium]
MPRLSILVPTYNRASWLQECLDSLAITTVDCEIVVSDNASTDGTSELLTRYEHDPRFRIFRQPENFGAGHNYAFVLEQARGELLCMFGDDDQAMPGCFEAKLAMFDAMPELDLVYSLWHRIDTDGRDLGVVRWPGLLGHSYAGG